MHRGEPSALDPYAGVCQGSTRDARLPGDLALPARNHAPRIFQPCIYPEGRVHRLRIDLDCHIYGALRAENVHRLREHAGDEGGRDHP